MIDLSILMAAVTAAAWLVTRRITPGNAAAAHRIWLAVLSSPVLWLAGITWLSPVAYVRPRSATVVAILSAPNDGLWTAVFWVYIVVAAALIVRVVVGVLEIHRLLRSSARIDVRELERVTGMASLKGFDVREGDIRMPVTAGALRPVVVLPLDWRAISPSGLTAILRHELAHIRRRDSLVTLVCALLEGVFWFNPAVWLATAQVRWFAEMACDAEAARGMNGDEYAAELLALASTWSEEKRPFYALTAGAGRGAGLRIQLLLDEMEHGHRRRRALPILVGIIILVMPLASTVRVDGVVPKMSATADSHDGSSHQDDHHGRNHQLRHNHRH